MEQLGWPIPSSFNNPPPPKKKKRDCPTAFNSFWVLIQENDRKKERESCVVMVWVE